MPPSSSLSHPPSIAPAAAARWAARVPADESPWLHEEVARRMEERLQWIRREPQHWVHWAPLRGGLQAHRRIAQRYPQAACRIAGEDAPGAAQRALAALRPAGWQRLKGWLGGAVTLAAGEPAEGQAQMLWANMALHMAADPQALLARWHRTLAVDGFVMFSALGPDTLRELRALYAELGWPPPAHEFTDMHDWGDMLVQAGFAEPVMDMERLVFTWDSPQRLLAELRTLGANLHRDRFAGLRGRRWRERLHEALAQRLADPAQGGRLALTFEIVYGHAFKPAPRLKVAAESALSLRDMRDMLGKKPAR